MTKKAAMEANTVTVGKVDGTSLWTWIRYIRATGDADEIGMVHGVPAPFPYPDSDSALGHAKAVNADLPDSAFTVAS